MIDYYETKEHPITKRMVLDAFKEIRTNGKAAGVDEVSIGDYAKNIQRNLYKLWNRMTSGSYYPSAVREKRIPKKDGGFRSLGIPTVEDRVAQQVVKTFLEPKVEESFHEDSYGYRPNKHAHQAIKVAWSRCTNCNWVLDVDIKAFFDTIDHELMMKAVKVYTSEKWVLMYIERWLKAGILQEDGELVTKDEGSPQGAVISPLLSNIFLHFVFDKWMQTYHPELKFVRYCDDIIIHCKSERHAKYIKELVAARMQRCKLSLNLDKTKIVYCKSETAKRAKHDVITFDFLGYTFRPKYLYKESATKLIFIPAMSRKAKKNVNLQLRRMRIQRSGGTIHQLAALLNPKIAGWMNYYCEYFKYSTMDVWKAINERITRWVQYTKKVGQRRARKWLVHKYKTKPRLFAHWSLLRPY